MDIIQTKQWIIDNLLMKSGLIGKRCTLAWFTKYNKLDAYHDIFRLTSFLDDITPPITQRIWHIIHNKLYPVACANPACNNYPTFTTFMRGYLRACSTPCAQFDPQTIHKIKTTNLKRYGTEYGVTSPYIINKRQKTVRRKYGVENISQFSGISEKKKQTCQKNYGTDWFLNRSDLVIKCVQDKYGVDNIAQVEEIALRRAATLKFEFYDFILTSEKFSSITPLFTREEYKGCKIEHNFLCNLCNSKFIAKFRGGVVPRCSYCFPKMQGSSFQREVLEYVKTLVQDDIDVVENTRQILPSGKELDVYIPALKIAVECNGLYWHSEIAGDKSKNYHLNKTLECEQLGIRLFHIFDDEWINKTTLVENKLRYLFQTTTDKVYARKCQIKLVSYDDKKEFLNTHHIQGNDRASIRLGLYHDNILVSVMTFNKLRVCINNKAKNKDDGSFELVRFASSTNVTGGASKLLSYFIKNYKPTNIISYADRRWSIGNLYEKLGFKKTSNGTPNYWYFGKAKEHRRFHRFAFAKHTLRKKLKNFNPELSEWQNMQNNGWDRIWDCGSLRFLLTPTY